MEAQITSNNSPLMQVDGEGGLEIPALSGDNYYLEVDRLDWCVDIGHYYSCYLLKMEFDFGAECDRDLFHSLIKDAIEIYNTLKLVGLEN